MFQVVSIADYQGTIIELEKTSSSSAPPYIYLSPEEIKQHYDRISLKLQDMGVKFQKLFRATKESLRREKVSVKELVENLESLSTSPTFMDTGQSRLCHQRQELADAQHIDDVISIIKDYCSACRVTVCEGKIREAENQFGLV